MPAKPMPRSLQARESRSTRSTTKSASGSDPSEFWYRHQPESKVVSWMPNSSGARAIGVSGGR